MAKQTAAQVIKTLRDEASSFKEESWKVRSRGDEHVAEGLLVQASRCSLCADELEKTGAMPIFERGKYLEPWRGYMKYSRIGPNDLRDFFPEAYE